MNRKPFAQQYAERDFTKAEIKALARKGMTLVDIQMLPDSDGTYFNPVRAYLVDDRGTGRVCRYMEVRALADPTLA
jgi:hypothetical protein